MVIPSLYPLIQAPMAGAQNSELTIAVCQSGGLGSLPASQLTPAQLATEIAHIRAATAAPFNVNFFAHHMPVLCSDDSRRWRKKLQPYFDQYAIDADQIQTGVLRLPFNHDYLTVLQQYRPEVVSFHFGLPEASLMAAIKATGAMILSSATTVAEADWLVAHGADMIIAQGWEAGGHRATFLGQDHHFQMSTMTLTSQLVKRLAVPVIASGGLSSASEIQAMMALGASAVQLGSAFLLCTESRIHSLYRQALLQATRSPELTATAITNIFSGKPARGLINRAMRELNYCCDEVAPFPYAATAINAIRAKTEAQGLVDFTPLWCGQNLSGAAEIPAHEQVKRLMGL